MPIELAILDAALQFHILPDEIENMSAYWWNLWQVFVQEKNRG